MLTEEKKEEFTPEYKNHVVVYVHEKDCELVIVHHHVVSNCQNTIYQRCVYVETFTNFFGARMYASHKWDLCQN